MASTSNLRFIPRSELRNLEWDETAKLWDRPGIDRDTLSQLTKRSTLSGSVRIIVHLGLIVATGWLAVFAGGYHILLAVVPFVANCWLVGFLHGIEHEMRHKIVFPSKLGWLSDIFYFLIHVHWKAGSRYQRVSHVIHHQYTMVRGVDPEPAFPEDITEKWVRKELRQMLITVLTLGIVDFFKAMWELIKRTAGKLNPMIQAQCSEKDMKFIRRESFVVLLINIAGLVVFATIQRWDLLMVLILAPEIGHAIGAFYHRTEHIGMMYNTTDQRLATRGVKVSPITRFFFGGLDEHVEHHTFPAVPSRNLTRLRKALEIPIPERNNVIACWKEIFAIARHRESNPDEVFIPNGYPIP